MEVLLSPDLPAPGAGPRGDGDLLDGDGDGEAVTHVGLPRGLGPGGAPAAAAPAHAPPGPAPAAPPGLHRVPLLAVLVQHVLGQVQGRGAVGGGAEGRGVARGGLLLQLLLLPLLLLLLLLLGRRQEGEVAGPGLAGTVVVLQSFQRHLGLLFFLQFGFPNGFDSLRSMKKRLSNLAMMQ